MPVIPRAQRRPAAAALAVVLPVVLALGGCMGYQIGNRSLYPSHIQTVYVPTFDSNSFRRDFGERLTEAVIKEIELKTPYKVVNTPNADSVLTAHILGENKQVVARDYYDDPRQVQVNMTVQVDWVDRRGQMLRSTEAMALPPELAVVAGSSDLTPEVGQSVATAQQQAIQRTAEQIVAMMEKPW
ncbi:MAG: LptE family protein [Pirellulales bacterium]|nr:LptE family protein [Pirellulales bacterium]